MSHEPIIQLSLMNDIHYTLYTSSNYERKADDHPKSIILPYKPNKISIKPFGCLEIN